MQEVRHKCKRIATENLFLWFCKISSIYDHVGHSDFDSVRKWMIYFKMYMEKCLNVNVIFVCHFDNEGSCPYIEIVSKVKSAVFIYRSVS